MVNQLIFAEDPGAANFLSALPNSLAKVGETSRLFACGHAANVFERDSIPFERIQPPLSELNSFARQLIESVGPVTVVCGTAENPDSLGLYLLSEANKLGLNTVGVVDMAVNAGRRFRGRTDRAFEYAPKHLLVPDEATKEAFRQIGYADSIHVVGYPQYDFVREIAASLTLSHDRSLLSQKYVEIDPARPVITFVAEPASIMSPELSTRNQNYRFSGVSNTNFRTLIVLEEVIRALEEVKSAAQLIVRLHPKSAPEDFEPYRQSIVALSQSDGAFELLSCSDLVIGMTTMLIQESVWMGRCTLSICPERDDEARLPVLKNNLIPIAKNRRELVTLLLQFESKALVAPDPESLFKRGAKERLAKVIADLRQSSVVSTGNHKCGEEDDGHEA
jgi:hypothetical protein